MAKWLHQYSADEFKAYLTEKGIAFAPDAKHADLKALALAHKKSEEEAEKITALKELLTEKGIVFSDEATLEELEALAPAEEKSDETKKVADWFVKVRNESNRMINGLHPWQIKEIKEENLELYQSYGCVLFTGQPAPETPAEVSAPVDTKDIPPHQR